MLFSAPRLGSRLLHAPIVESGLYAPRFGSGFIFFCYSENGLAKDVFIGVALPPSAFLKVWKVYFPKLELPRDHRKQAGDTLLFLTALFSISSPPPLS